MNSHCWRGQIQRGTLQRDAVKVDAVISTIGFPLVGGPAGWYMGLPALLKNGADTIKQMCVLCMFSQCVPVL